MSGPIFMLPFQPDLGDQQPRHDGRGDLTKGGQMKYRKITRRNVTAKRSKPLAHTAAQRSRRESSRHFFSVRFLYGLIDATTTSPWGIIAIVMLVLMLGVGRALALW